MPVWNGPEAWLAAVAQVLSTPAGEAARRNLHPEGKHIVSIRTQTVLDVAAADARAARSATGRGVSTAHATVADELGCSPATVKRARVLLERLGLAITLDPGRYLSSEERAEATAHHGGDQRRIASERALLMPRDLAPGENDHLPRRGHLEMESPGEKNSPTRASAQSEAASRPRPRRGECARRAERPTISVQRLAADLARRLPWLAHGHIASLCAVLTDVGLDDEGWSALDVIDLLDRRNIDAGLDALPAASQRSPLALLRHQLTDALTDVHEAPRARRRRQAERRAAAAAASAAARAAEAAALAAQREDPAAQARIQDAQADIRATIAALPRRTRR